MTIPTAETCLVAGLETPNFSPVFERDTMGLSPMIDFAQRINIPELMDSEDLSTGELESTLRFLSATNRYLGGNNALFSYLESWSRDWPKGGQISLLDAGTGGADMPMAVVDWGRQAGFDLKITAIDSTPKIAEIARRRVRDYPEIEIAEADFFSYRSNNQKFDYVLCSLFLHHLPDDLLIEALKLGDRLSRRGIIVLDLLRSPLSFYGVKALTSLFGNHIVQNDGPISVRRAFRPEELEALARQAGLPYLRVRRHPFFRLSLAGQKSA